MRTRVQNLSYIKTTTIIFVRMNSKRVYLLSAVIAVALLALLVLLRSRTPESQEPGLPPPTAVDDSGTEAVEVETDLKMQDTGDEFAQANDEPKDPEIERLQEFLDDNDNESILAQAAFLAESEDEQRRIEAIDALVWVSTPQAARTLLPLLDDNNPEIAVQALHGLGHILNTISLHVNEDAETGELAVSEEEGSLMTDELLQETYDLWLAACKAAKNADDLDTLLISLSGLDVKFCVPLLVDVLESTTGEMHNVALEHLDIATNRDGVTNREEAALWLMKEAEE